MTDNFNCISFDEEDADDDEEKKNETIWQHYFTFDVYSKCSFFRRLQLIIARKRCMNRLPKNGTNKNRSLHQIPFEQMLGNQI